MTNQRVDVMYLHPSTDLYGSDLQLIETIAVSAAMGLRALVVLPGEGPLATRIREAFNNDVRICFMATPVLRRSVVSPAGATRFLLSHIRFIARSTALLNRHQPRLMFVNTLTIPSWLLIGKMRRFRVICHVHEAEDDGPKWKRRLLAMPLLAARKVIVNSGAAQRALVDVLPMLEERAVLIYNGIPDRHGPAKSRPGKKPPPSPNSCVDLLFVGRLSPRKGPDILLESCGHLVRLGLDVRVTLAGSVFPGYEWFEAQLRRRAGLPDLDGKVQFRGYVENPWTASPGADVAVIPSRLEPFGNTAVEAQLAGIPMIAAATQGLMEIVEDEKTGLLFDNSNAAHLTVQILRCVNDYAGALSRAETAGAVARNRFSLTRYTKEIRNILEQELST